MNNNLKTAILLCVIFFMLSIVLYNLFFQFSFEGFEEKEEGQEKKVLDNSGNNLDNSGNNLDNSGNNLDNSGNNLDDESKMALVMNILNKQYEK